MLVMVWQDSPIDFAQDVEKLIILPLKFKRAKNKNYEDAYNFKRRYLSILTS